MYQIGHIIGHTDLSSEVSNYRRYHLGSVILEASKDRLKSPKKHLKMNLKSISTANSLVQTV